MSAYRRIAGTVRVTELLVVGTFVAECTIKLLFYSNYYYYYYYKCTDYSDASQSCNYGSISCRF